MINTVDATKNRKPAERQITTAAAHAHRIMRGQMQIEPSRLAKRAWPHRPKRAASQDRLRQPAARPPQG
jgi:hypothetical protein